MGPRIIASMLQLSRILLEDFIADEREQKCVDQENYLGWILLFFGDMGIKLFS